MDAVAFGDAGQRLAGCTALDSFVRLFLFRGHEPSRRSAAKPLTKTRRAGPRRTVMLWRRFE